MKEKKLWKEILPYGVALFAFILFTLIYCSSAMEGKVLHAGDNKTWAGGAQELIKYRDSTDNSSWWTGSMFSGMPSFQITGSYQSSKYLLPLYKLVTIGFSKPYVWIITYLLCFFILLRSFKVNVWMSILGSIAISLSSYFFIIIPAGHWSKAACIAYMAPVIAGFFLIYNKNYIWGAILTAIYTITGFFAHPQMSYYFMMLIGCLFVAELFIHIKEKRWKDFIIATLLFAFVVGIGIGTHFTIMQVNNEYLKETMRGGHSELAKVDDEHNKTSGLDLDYAVQWSYGIDETFTLLIPNFKGSSSNYDVGTDSKVYQELVAHNIPKKSAADFCKNVPTYWGTQPFTAGPVYVGAIIVFLFVLGLLIVKGPYKWALLVATIFSILLSWGHNFMWLTKFFFDYFPMYDKFRAVSSILVVAEVTIPLLGFLAIKAIMNKQLSKEKIIKNIYISAGITAGICLIFALFGKMFYNFGAPNDAQVFAQLPDWLGDAIIAERASMLTGDAWRSFFFILLGAAALWLYTSEKLKMLPFVAVLGVLILVDMWTVDRRYFNANHFVSEKQDESYFKKQDYEEYILQDKDPHFRVFNLADNTFNESRTSYYFKSLGGYSGVKLRRYQDLIDQHLSKMNWKVINMLNAKYIIFKAQNGQIVPQLNPDAMGNAWFVDSLYIVDNPNAESGALDSLNLHTTAVVDASKFGDFVKDFVPHHDSTAKVEFLSYKPNELEYKTIANEAGTVVFSEIYYPYGWHAYIDDIEVPHFRVNYALRALNVPAGEHHIHFVFDPDTLHKSELISFVCVIAIYIIIIGGVVWYFVKRKRHTEMISK